MQTNKVVIIGTGNVGMSYAYALFNQRTQVNEIVLIDVNTEDAEGEATDLSDTLAFVPSVLKVSAGTYADCKDAEIVCITAGAKQEVGETRLDLVHKNATIIKDIVSQVMSSGFNGIFLVVSNPVDVMTYLTYKYSGLPAERVIGSGTVLDTSRLRQIVGAKLSISPKDVYGFAVGEHGDSEFIPWSDVKISMKSISDFLSPEDQAQIETDVKNRSYTIINKKGSTYYGIGVCLVYITNVILSDENAILPVSNYVASKDVFIGLPAILGRGGVKERIHINLNSAEQKKLDGSIAVVKSAISSVV